jgi:Holliday junction DNA helicase RuvB
MNMDTIALPAEYLQCVQRQSPRPRGWADVVGNARAISMIREAVEAGRIQGRAPSHMLLWGPPGVGKTTLAELVASDVGGGIVSTTASTLETPADVLVILETLNRMREVTGRPSTLAIDELHRLGEGRSRQAIDAESIYPLLEDWHFPHNVKTVTYEGQVYKPRTSDFLVWPFCLVGATTEPGALPSALLRRFLVHVPIEQYSEVEIARVIAGTAGRMGWDMTADAAVELAKYARRNPGRALQLSTSAHNRAIATGRTTVDVGVVLEVIGRLNLHPLGLGEEDVRVLEILAERAPRGVGAAELARGLGVALSTFTGMLEPYLTMLGMIRTLSRRTITPAGLAYLADLGRGAASRPAEPAAVAS